MTEHTNTTAADRVNLSPEQVRAAVRAGRDLAHSREYDNALRVAGRTGPAWGDLSDEQRAAIRAENYRYWAEMNDFAKELTQ